LKPLTAKRKLEALPATYPVSFLVYKHDILGGQLTKSTSLLYCPQIQIKRTVLQRNAAQQKLLIAFA